MALSKKSAQKMHFKRSATYVMIALALIVLLGSAYNLYEIREGISQNLRFKMLDDAMSIKDDVEEWLLEDQAFLNAYNELIANLTYEELSYAKVGNKYIAIDYQKHGIDAMYIGMENGLFLTGRDWVPSKGYDPRVRPWYVGAMKAQGPYIGDTYLDSDTQKYIYSLSRPIRTKNNFLGVISIDIYMDTIAEHLKSLVSGTDFEVALIDGQDTIIHYTGDPFLAMKPVSDYEQSELYKRYEAYKDLADQNENYLVMDDSQMMVIEPLKYSSWSICIFSKNDNLMATADAGIQRHITINGILLGLYGLVLVLFYRLNKGWQLKELALEQKIETMASLLDRDEDGEGEVDANARGYSTHLSKLDNLTRVFNRPYFDQQLEVYWALSLEEHRPIGALLINFDYFKQYNDQFGYPAGDEALTTMCKAIVKLLEPQYILARYSGSTFAILNYNSSLEGLRDLATAIQACLEDMAKAHPHPYSPFGHLTVSIGIMEDFATANDSSGNYVRRCVMALYQAKSTGRNRIEVWQSKSV